jgi:hypothetical protein
MSNIAPHPMYHAEPLAVIDAMLSKQEIFQPLGVVFPDIVDKMMYQHS